MVTSVGGFAKTIFDQIELLYIDVLGPIAGIIAQEALDDWSADLKLKGLKPSLRHISGYIDMLVLEINDDVDRENFINSVFEIKALILYKQLYKGTT